MPARRVLFLTHASQFGGAELSLLEILRHLDRDRVEPVLASFSRGPLLEEAEKSGVRTELFEAPETVVAAKRREFVPSPALPFRVAAAYARTFPVLMRIFDFINAEGIQLVYTNSSKAHVTGGIAGKKAGVPVIWHYRDYPESAALRMFFAGMSLAVANTVVCNSKFTSRQFANHWNAKVVYNGIPADTVVPIREPAEVRAELGFAETDSIVGAAGRIDRWKGFHVFLRAAAVVAKEVPEAKFVVAGGPVYGSEKYEEELGRIVIAEGLSGRVVFTGFRKDIYDIMNIFDVYVHPSVSPEPFGRGIVEAMLLGKPVAASAAGGPREIIEHKRSGHLFMPGDERKLAAAVVTILSNGEYAAGLAAAGRRRALDHFGVERCVDSLTKIILEAK